MLKASASVMGYTDMCYAVGAILAGITIPVFIIKTSSYKAVVVTAATYTAGTLLIAWFPIVGLFLLIQICLGWGNAGARVARNTIMMETVPNQLIGRVNSLFSAIGMFIRVCLLGLFSKTVAYTGTSISLSITGSLLLAAFIGIILSRKIFVEQSSSLKLQNTIIE
jgi:MFS family permease